MKLKLVIICMLVFHEITCGSHDDKKKKSRIKKGKRKLRITRKQEIMIPYAVYKDVLNENKKLITLQKDLENCQKQCEVYEALLGLRYRIESLEDLLYPEELISINNRPLKWKILLETQPNHAVVQQLRDRISRQHLTIDVFSKTISKLYTKYSNSGIHQVKGKLYNETEMDKIIQVNKGNLDELELSIIAILFKTLELNISESNKTLDTSFKCIRITRIPTDTGIEEKIRNYFHKRKSILRITKEEGGIYIVEFENMNAAIAAFLNHQSAIDNVVVHLTLWNNNRGIDFIEEN